MPEATLTLSASDDTRFWRRRLFSCGRLSVTLPRLIGALLVIALLVWGCLAVDFGAVKKWIEALSAPGLITSTVLLPLVGFPVSWLHFVVGMRFDLATGLLVIAITTLAHDTLAWAMVLFLPRRLFRRLAPWRKKLARAGHVEATLLSSILPGVPYTVQLYLLPLLGVPWRIITGVGVPIHTARSLVSLLLADATTHPDAAKIIFAGVYYVIVFALSAWIGRKLQKRLASQRARR